MSDTFQRKEMPRRLGGGWFHSTELLDGEEIQMEADAFHKPSRSQQGGKLFLTNKRLVYLPDRWAAIVGDSRVAWPLEQIDDAGMTRADNAGIIFRSGNLLVFECMWVERSHDRHLFSTRLPLTDREWVAAIKAATPSNVPEAAPAEAASEEAEGAAEPTETTEAADA